MHNSQLTFPQLNEVKELLDRDRGKMRTGQTKQRRKENKNISVNDHLQILLVILSEFTRIT